MIRRFHALADLTVLPLWEAIQKSKNLNFILDLLDATVDVRPDTGDDVTWNHTSVTDPLTTPL